MYGFFERNSYNSFHKCMYVYAVVNVTVYKFYRNQ